MVYTNVQCVLRRTLGTSSLAGNFTHITKPLSVNNFQDSRVVYARKDTKDLLRAYLVLKLCSAEFIVQNSLQLLETGQNVLGKSLLEKLLRPTLYAQFVGGDDIDTLKRSVASLTKDGLRLMVLPSLEEDVGQVDEEMNSKSKYDINTETTLTLANATAELGGPNSCLQTKITAIIPAETLVKIAEAYNSTEENLQAIGTLAEALSGGKAVNLAKLSSSDLVLLNEGLARYKAIGEAAQRRQLRLLVDGEYTYLNPAISLMAMSLAAAFNNERPVVWNTYQCYLQNACDKILTELDITKKLGVKFGAKIVRGAYLERERQLAKEGNYSDPTNPTYEATGVVYDRVVRRMMTEVRSRPDSCHIIVATHNETSILRAVEAMQELQIKPDDDVVVFGQLYGMADHISVTLSQAGYIVYKSVPYGQLEQVLPYLSRRATENKAVLRGSRRDLLLLKQAIRNRVLWKV